VKSEMKSEIWRVVTQRIGSIEAFGSEREMQAFLMNNPAIVGCWDPDSKGAFPSLVREEVFSRGAEGSKGRMDIVGVSKKEDGEYELRIFELKLGEIDGSAVKQLNHYLKSWDHESGPKIEIKKWVLSLKLPGIDESNVDDFIRNPIGVLVGSKFAPDAIKEALTLDIKGIRLARFKGGARLEHEYYVIIEDQVGTIISSTKKYWSWDELIKAKLIEKSDVFFISPKEKGIQLRAVPDSNYLSYKWNKVIYDEESRKILIEKEEEIREKAKSDEYAKKWIDRDLQALRKGDGHWLSYATGLCYFAFGGPAKSYWSPTSWWTHEKTGKSLSDLIKELRK
jgi:hypothetical protein